MRKIVATLTRRHMRQPGAAGPESTTEVFAVEVIAIAQRYAMVRRKGCMPFVADFTELKDIK